VGVRPRQHDREKTFTVNDKPFDLERVILLVKKLIEGS